MRAQDHSGCLFAFGSSNNNFHRFCCSCVALIPMARNSSVLLRFLAAASLAVLACQYVGTVFVGAGLRGSRPTSMPRQVGVDYLLRNGPKDADPPLINTATAAGAPHEVTFKKRPFGIARYAPGSTGTGAVVMEVTPKSRYPGDPQGQAFVAGVQPGWVVKSVNGQDVTGIPFEQIMESLDDEVLDPVGCPELESQGVRHRDQLRFIYPGRQVLWSGGREHLPILVEVRRPNCQSPSLTWSNGRMIS